VQSELHPTHSEQPIQNDLEPQTLWDPDSTPHYCAADMSQFTLRVKDLPVSERPRDRLIQNGASHLSTGELLSILLGTGQGAGKLSAVGLAQHVLQTLSEHQSDLFASLRTITVEELMAISGIGPAKAATVVAAIELGKRVYFPPPSDQPMIDDPAVAVAVLSQDLMWQPQEHFAVLLLDIKHRLLSRQVLTIGTATETLAHPRDIFREVIRKGATRVIVAHNHPSTSLEPSGDDLALTRQLLESGKILGIPVLDHLILGGGDYRSLRQTTNLWQEIDQE
jgi:DNA repair protein RadC